MTLMRRLINAVFIYKLLPKLLMELRGGVVRLRPLTTSRGSVLISYTTLPFVGRKIVLGGHTNQWESKELALIFQERGYEVDVIESTNHSFIPKKEYRYFLDVHVNLDRLASYVPATCTKILHATTSYWKFQNEAEQKRIEAIRARRGVTLTPRRQLPPSRAFEIADVVSLLGNQFTEATYPRGKKITRIPVSTTHLFETPLKDTESARKNFIWFGGSGMVHKGLDLVLEAFAAMPEYSLTICGKVENESDFVAAYTKELYETPNIKVVGPVDAGSELFEKLRQNAIAFVYPSCSEGQSGAVVLCMHAGLIPIASEISGVDIEGCGIALKESSIEEIKNAVRTIAATPAPKLKAMAQETWNYARSHHTRKHFATAYRNFVDELEQRHS